MGTVIGGASIRCRGVVRAASIAAVSAIVVSGIGPTQSMAAPNAVANQLIVGFGSDVSQAKQLEAERSAKVLPHVIISPHEEVVKTDPGQTIEAAAAKLRASPAVRYAVANLIVRTPSFTPNDRGTTDFPGGWRIPQWNFMATNGVNAIGAWAQAAQGHRSGGSGVTIALIDTGVAFTNHDSFRLAPDLAFSTFTSPWDFIYNNPWPLDRNGHGTFLAGTIAETTNNFAYMTGLAWGAKIMPLRILNAWGYGHSDALSSAIRYAADHGANVINLSLQFPDYTKAADIPNVIAAITYATAKGSLVVAAGGNEPMSRAAYPAMADGVLGVGATTEHRCLANYSNHGEGVDIVAPGGGGDANIPGDTRCNAFTDSADPMGNPYFYGSGLLDAARAAGG